MDDWKTAFSTAPCRACGHLRLRRSRYLSLGEQLVCWWRNTAPFRCQSCGWRGELPDVWIAPAREPVSPAAERIDWDGLEPPDADLPFGNSGERIKLWLDDWRPAPDGWVHVTNVGAAQRLLAHGLVDEASLDHDLGRCGECQDRPEYRNASAHDQCPHMLSGYDLCVWMAMTNHWSSAPPTVHSGNVEGAARMRGLILRHWHAPGTPASSHLELSAEEASRLTSAFEELRLDVRSAKLSVCPSCYRPALYRLHRSSGWQRLRSMVLAAFPARCQQCGWQGWIKGPLMVRLEATRDRAVVPIPEELDRLDP